MINITDATFNEEVTNNTGIVLVDFWAAWCGPCKAIVPTLERIEKKYSEKVKIVKLNVDENPVTTDNFGVRSIPSLMFFKNGEDIKTIVGSVDDNVIETVLDKLLA